MYSGKTNYFLSHANPKRCPLCWEYGKPWNTSDGRIPPRYFNKYQDFFETQSDLANLRKMHVQAFPDSLKYHRKSLLQHWLRLSKMKTYLNRFKTPYDVLNPHLQN